MSRTFRFALFGVLALVGALLLGVLVPSVTLASSPAQTPSPSELAQVVGGFLDLLIALAVGGGVAYILQMFEAWRNWSSPFKPVVVIVMTALLGGALTSLKVIATPEIFGDLPSFANAFIGFVVVFFGSQLTYQRGFAPQWVARTQVE